MVSDRGGHASTAEHHQGTVVHIGTACSADEIEEDCCSCLPVSGHEASAPCQRFLLLRGGADKLLTFQLHVLCSFISKGIHKVINLAFKTPYQSTCRLQVLEELLALRGGFQEDVNDGEPLVLLGGG